MLSPYLQSKLVTRLITTPNGKQFEVIFLVSIIGGKINARIVSAKAIQASDSAKAKPNLALASGGFFDTTEATDVVPTPFYADLYDELFFFVSQPTRAPARA